AYKGTLGDSAQAMHAALRTMSDAVKEIVRLYTYASLKRDENQGDAEAQELYGLAQNLYQELIEATSWMDPEILSVGAERVEQFIAEEAGLAPFTFSLRDTLRRAPHTLDEDGEALLAQASLALSQPTEIY